jgi:hypothetical protein
MNYTRRPNRPDGNVYRQMRRRNMGRGGGGSKPLNPKVLLAATVVVVAVVAWMIWR